MKASACPQSIKFGNYTFVPIDENITFPVFRCCNRVHGASNLDNAYEHAQQINVNPAAPSSPFKTRNSSSEFFNDEIQFIADPFAPSSPFKTRNSSPDFLNDDELDNVYDHAQQQQRLSPLAPRNQNNACENAQQQQRLSPLRSCLTKRCSASVHCPASASVHCPTSAPVHCPILQIFTAGSVSTEHTLKLLLVYFSRAYDNWSGCNS
uniref:Uncharacterized protein n=1 Tax=Globodera pallida TaxID=36090 RepID=A0A183BYR9_GLOPA